MNKRVELADVMRSIRLGMAYIIKSYRTSSADISAVLAMLQRADAEVIEAARYVKESKK